MIYSPAKLSCELLASSTPVAVANFIIKALKFSKEKPAYIYFTTTDSINKRKHILHVKCLPLEPKSFEIVVNVPAKLLRQTVEIINLLNPNCPITKVSGIGLQNDDFLYGYTTATLHH